MLILSLFNMLCFSFRALIHNLWFFMLLKDGDTSSGSDSPNESEEENISNKKAFGNKSN
jgi:hypothetical protein